MIYAQSSFGRSFTSMAVALLVMATACKGRTVSVASGTLDTAAVRHFKTFSVMAPKPSADTVAVAATNGNGHAEAAVMDMDPMLGTSIVGRAIRQDLTDAFMRRGYQLVSDTPDFYVAYFAGTGHVVDTRAWQQSYRTNGQQITTQTRKYPAGTIVVDVVDARSDSLVWRGTAVAPIPRDPNDYAQTIGAAVDKIVRTFPKARQ